MADVLRPAVDVNAGWANRTQLKWLTEDYFRNNAGSRFVANADLSKMAGPSTGFNISTDALRSELAAEMKKSGTTPCLPFDYLEVDGHYLSMAELFQVLTDELTEFHRTGKLPPNRKNRQSIWTVSNGDGPWSDAVRSPRAI